MARSEARGLRSTSLASGPPSAQLANPCHSTGERAGRTAIQAVTVGGAASTGGLVGAEIDTALLPGVGTLAGALLAAAGAAIEGYHAGEYADEHNDSLVDAGGELGDVVEDGVKDLDPW